MSVQDVAAEGSRLRGRAARQALRGALIQGPEVTFASGVRSRVYLDKWRLLAHPAGWHAVQLGLATLWVRLSELDYYAIVACPALGAVPFAAVLAYSLDRRLLVVRRSPNDHGAGTGRRLTWEPGPGERVVLVEDVVTSGQTVLESVHLLRAAGLVVESCVCLVDRESGGAEALGRLGVTLYSLARLAELLEPEPEDAFA